MSKLFQDTEEKDLKKNIIKKMLDMEDREERSKNTQKMSRTSGTEETISNM